MGGVYCGSGPPFPGLGLVAVEGIGALTWGTRTFIRPVRDLWPAQTVDGVSVGGFDSFGRYNFSFGSFNAPVSRSGGGRCSFDLDFGSSFYLLRDGTAIPASTNVDGRLPAETAGAHCQMNEWVGLAFGGFVRERASLFGSASLVRMLVRCRPATYTFLRYKCRCLCSVTGASRLNRLRAGRSSGQGGAEMTIRSAGVFRETSPSGAGPSIREAVNAISSEEREAVAAYLDAGVMIGAVPGLARDVLGGPEYVLRESLLTDGAWVWRAWLGHYVRTYGVAVPEEIVNRALAGERPRELSPEGEDVINAWLRAMSPDQEP